MSEQDAADADDEATAEQSGEEASAPEADAGGSTDDDPAAATPGSDDADEADDAVDDQLVDRVASSEPEEVAHEIAALRTEIEGLEGELADREAEVEELTAKLKRKQADFQNYKKRVEERREEERRRAMADFVRRLLDVRDNLVRALEQDEDADIRDGVEATLRQFDDVLQAEDVEPVEPDPGADVDPERHQVLARVDSDRPEGAIDEVHRPGYVMDEAVVREAQVTVSDGTEAGTNDDADDAADGDETGE